MKPLFLSAATALALSALPALAQDTAGDVEDKAVEPPTRGEQIRELVPGGAVGTARESAPEEAPTSPAQERGVIWAEESSI